MERIIIIGSSGHAKVVAEAVSKAGNCELAGFIDSEGDTDKSLLGLPVLGVEDDLPDLVDRLKLTGIAIAIGDNFVRTTVAKRIARSLPTLRLATVVHPAATIGTSVVLNEGSVVLAGAIVSVGATVGRLCLLNTGSSLDHDSIMEDGSSLAPGVAVGGNCRIGVCSAIGIGAAVVHGVAVGEHTIVGAGSTVVKDLESHSLAYGTPARAIRKRTEGERYF